MGDGSGIGRGECNLGDRIAVDGLHPAVGPRGIPLAACALGARLALGTGRTAPALGIVGPDGGCGPDGPGALESLAGGSC
ncbi:hypothetical protein GCM10010341_39830 [Streptomyces noursei]|nr:hypothetical protein GCM10010341_39830 [Streptomyces noursei]